MRVFREGRPGDRTRVFLAVLRVVNLNNYSSCYLTKRLSVPREKLELIIDNRAFIPYFSLDFQFLDLRKINKD